MRSVAASSSRLLGVINRVSRIFDDGTLVAKYYWSFVLLVLEYCSPAWNSTAACHLVLLDRVVRTVGDLQSVEV